MECTLQKQIEQVLASDEIDFEKLCDLAEQEIGMAIASIGDFEDFAILKHQQTVQWQVVLPDVSGGGYWRLQAFDKRSFSGHMIFKSKAVAIRNAAQMMFTIRDDAALDRIQDTPEFQVGSYANEQLALHNRGEISFAEYIACVKAFEDECISSFPH